MAEQRSVMKEFRQLDEKLRTVGLSKVEEARWAELRDLVDPGAKPARRGQASSAGAGPAIPSDPPRPGFDVNAAADALRASLEPAGLRRPAAPPAATASEEDVLDLDAEPPGSWLEPSMNERPADAGAPAFGAEQPVPDAMAPSFDAPGQAWEASVPGDAMQAPATLFDTGMSAPAHTWEDGAQVWDPNAPAGDPAAQEWDPNAPWDPNAQAWDPNAQAWDPNAQPADPNAQAWDLSEEPADPNAQAWDPNAQPGDPNAQAWDPNAQPADPNAQAWDPNAQPADPNAQAWDPNAQPADPNAQAWDLSAQPADPNAETWEPNAEGAQVADGAATATGYAAFTDPNAPLGAQPWEPSTPGSGAGGVPSEPAQAWDAGALPGDSGIEAVDSMPAAEASGWPQPGIGGQSEGTGTVGGHDETSFADVLPTEGAPPEMADQEPTLDWAALDSGAPAFEPGVEEPPAIEKVPAGSAPLPALGDWAAEAPVSEGDKLPGAADEPDLFGLASGGSFAAELPSVDVPLNDELELPSSQYAGDAEAPPTVADAPPVDFERGEAASIREAARDAVAEAPASPEPESDVVDISEIMLEEVPAGEPGEILEATELEAVTAPIEAPAPAMTPPPSFLDVTQPIPMPISPPGGFPVDAASPRQTGSPAELHASPSFIAGSHRVVVHTIEGQAKRGTISDTDLDAAEIGLAPQTGGVPESIPASRIKAIFFILPPGGSPPEPEGRKVRVTFKDGRQVAGFSEDYAPEQAGFFMVPADTRTNTERIWVYRDAVRQVSVS